MNKEQLGKFIKEERKKLGLTQVALAGKCKCRRQAIIELENNRCETGYTVIATVLENLGYDLRPVQSGKRTTPHPKNSPTPARFDFTTGKDEPPTTIVPKDDLW